MIDGVLRLGRIELRPGFLIVSAAAMLFAPAMLIGHFLAAAALHELGHMVALYALGGSVEQIRISALGAELEYRKERLSYCRELAVYLAGPLASALAGITSAFVAKALGSETMYIFSGASMLLGAFNLLPARSLDGGGALRVLSLVAFDREVLALDILHYTVVAALVALGLWISAHGGFNLALFWIAAWMLIGNIDH